MMRLKYYFNRVEKLLFLFKDLEQHIINLTQQYNLKCIVIRWDFFLSEKK